MTSIYKNASAEGAPENKKNRWEVILGEDRYLKCRQDPSGATDGDTKSVKVYKICTGDGHHLYKFYKLLRFLYLHQWHH